MTISPDIHAGVATDMAKVKDDVRRMIEQAMSSGTLTKENLAGKIITRSEKLIRVAMGGFKNQGTPSHKIAHRGGRHRRVVAHRVLHATKGYYGGKKSSRRSNRTAGARK